MKKVLLAVAVVLPPPAPCSPRQTTPSPRSRPRAWSRWACAIRRAPCRTRWADGKYAGFHYELCQRILANLEKAAGKKLEVKYLPVTSQNRIPLVQNGTVDIECGSTTNNATRQKDVAFAVTTYVEEVRIVVKANSGINSLAT
jgi:glutamate/aspartate transport system substrate-binding protein